MPTDVSLDALLAELDRHRAAIGAIRDLLAELPDLERDWVDGGAHELQQLSVTMHSGEHAARDGWAAIAGAGRALVAVLPDASVLAELPVPDSRVPAVPRVLLGAPLDAEATVSAAAFAAAGWAIRVIDDAPAYFATDGVSWCSYPGEWGPGRPGVVLTLQDRVAAAGFGHYFDRLWRRGVPIEPPSPERLGLLRLLDEGLGDEEIAERLHLSERTLRRRLRETMAALGASNRFTLGLAWAAQSDGGRPA